MKINFYDDKGNVDNTLYDMEALKIAEKLIKNGHGVSRSQLRKLFDEVKRLEKKLSPDGKNWNDVYPLIRMLRSKAEYVTAKAKKNSRNDADFYNSLNNFIKEGIKCVKKREDYSVFCLLFEAVYGFYYSLGGANTK